MHSHAGAIGTSKRACTHRRMKLTFTDEAWDEYVYWQSISEKY